MNTFPQYKNKKVLIFGLGLNDGGLGMAEFFLEQGASLTITDGKTEEQLASTLEKLSKWTDKITYHLGGHIESDFREHDIIVRNPAIRPDNQYLEIARKAGIPIEMEMSLFMRLAPCKIIGISGTRGKSTTTTLVYLFLKEKYGDKVILAGNIGKSAIRELPNLNEENIVVLELSSFQLDAMRERKQSPNVALLTNIYQDHLNWHKDMEDYIDCKHTLFKFQKQNDIAVINIDDERANIAGNIVKISGAKLLTFSSENREANYYRSGQIIYENQEQLLSFGNMILDGEHNYHNALGAIALARQFGVTSRQINSILNTFAGVDGRQQTIRELKGITFVNDTTATSLEAMIVALNRFGPKYPKKLILISGGVDKDLDYSKLAPLLTKFVKLIVLLDGTASEKIKAVAENEGVASSGYFTVFKEAIEKAYKSATSGDCVVLCPGGASFNMFVNEFDRGKQYNKIVNELK